MGILDTLGLGGFNFGRGAGGGAMGGAGVGAMVPRSGGGNESDIGMGLDTVGTMGGYGASPERSGGLDDLLANPQFLMSMRMLSNGLTPSVGHPRPMFEGVAEAGAQGMEMQAFKQKQRDAATEKAETAQTKNRTVEWLRERDPEIAEMVENKLIPASQGVTMHLEKLKGKGKFRLENVNGKLLWINEDQQQIVPVEGFEKQQDPMSTIGKLQADLKNGVIDQAGYDLAIQAMGTRTGANVPTGYRATDPNNPTAGLEPIPGGPAEVIPAEQASRIGMAEVFLGRVPELRKKLQNGDVSGVYDQTMAQKGFGSQGQIYQELKSGTDALQRFMTGAGMPQSEAEEYAGRYLPTYKDTPATAVSKLDRLTEELEAARRMVMRGKRSEAEINRSVTPDVSTMSDADLEAIANGQ